MKFEKIRRGLKQALLVHRFNLFLLQYDTNSAHGSFPVELDHGRFAREQGFVQRRGQHIIKHKKLYGLI